MLNFANADRIITKNLDCLDPEKYQIARDQRGHSFLYTVTIKKTGKLLGRYRVEKRADGSVVFGSIQGNSPEWDLIWESTLNRILAREQGTMTDAMEQDYQRRQESYLKQIKELKANELTRAADD
jgi:hypothetical protein